MCRYTKLLMSILFFGMVVLISKVQVFASGDSFQTADIINVNSNVTDKLIDSNDENWYKFTISQDGYISLSFKHELVEQGDWYIELFYDEKNYMYERLHSGNYDKVVSTPNLGLPAGTYYIKVYPTAYWNGKMSTNDYDICVNFTSTNIWETESNETILSSDSIEVNKLYYGTLKDSNDEDWYKFTISQDGYISLSFKHELVEQGDWYIELFYDEKNYMYKRLHSGKYDKEVSTPNIGLSAGTYYFKIYRDSFVGGSSSVDYNMCINYTTTTSWETESNDTVITADLMYINASIYGSLKGESDLDYFAFNVEQDGFYTVSFTHDSVEKGDWSISVLCIINGERKIIQKYNSGPADTILEKRYSELSKGQYYVCVEKPSYDNYSGTNYGLSIKPSFIPQVNITKVKSPKKKQLNIKWGKVNEVTGYEVEIANNKKFTKGFVRKYALANKGSYTVKKLKRKKNYFVRVRAYVYEEGKYYYGAYSKVKKIKIK